MTKRRALIALLVVATLAVGYLGIGAKAWADSTATDTSCMTLHAAEAPPTFRAVYDGTVAFDAAPFRFAGAREVAFPSLEPGLTLQAWWAPPADPQAGTVIVVHGRNSCRHDPVSLLPAGMLHRHGYGVLLVDLRDHGTSDADDGHWSGGADEWQDVLGAWHWLRDQGYPARSIGMLGLSMGAGAVSYALGNEPAIAAAWLDSPYADILSMSMTVARQKGMPEVVAPGALLMGQVISGVDILGGSPERAIADHLDGRPLAIVHGTDDGTIPVEQGRRLAAAAVRGGTAVVPWIVEGARHVESAFVLPAEYERRVVAFFRSGLADVKP